VRRPPRLTALLHARLVRFAGVGFIATATDFLVFNAALAGNTHPGPIHVILANTSAFAVATLVGYALNARLTWGMSHRRQLLLRYAGVALLGALVYDAVLVGLLEATQADGYLALNAIKIAAVAVSATWNFIGFNFFVFRDPEARQPAAASEAGS